MLDDFKIISGGQSGADLGGIKFAQKYKIEHEVNTHRGFKPISGKIPDGVIVNYITEKTGVLGLRIRTEYNVKISDITLIFITRDLNKTRGSRLTARYCQDFHKNYIVIKIIDNHQYVWEYIDDNKKAIELQKILQTFDNLKNKGKKEKLIINVAGERYWNEDEIVKILEKIFLDDISRKN